MRASFRLPKGATPILRQTAKCLIALDLLLVAIATLLAFALRSNLDLRQDEFAQLGLYLSATLSAGVVVLWAKGAHRVIWRFTALTDYLNLASASAMIVACAVKAQADFIVTRDKDLLSLGSYAGIAMVTPERFRHMLRSGELARE